MEKDLKYTEHCVIGNIVITEKLLVSLIWISLGSEKDEKIASFQNYAYRIAILKSKNTFLAKGAEEINEEIRNPNNRETSDNKLKKEAGLC